MARRSFTAIGLAAGSVIGTVVLRRRRRKHQTRVDLYFSDGSMLALSDDAPEVAAVVGAASAILAGGDG